MALESINNLKSGLYPLPEKHEWVALLEGIYFDELVKRMSVFATGKYPEPIHVNGSIISQPLGSIDFFVEFNTSKVVGSYDPNGNLNEDNTLKPIDLKVKCNKRDIRLLRSIKHADAVAILFNSDQKAYIFTDGNTTIEISQSEYKELPSPYTLSGETIGVAVAADPDQMKLFKSSGNTVVLELFENQLERITFEGGISHSFSVGNTLNLMKKQPDRRLHSRHFLEIAGKDKVSLTIAKDSVGEYWLISDTKLSLNLTARTYEHLY